jgi:hypothetical protein
MFLSIGRAGGYAGAGNRSGLLGLRALNGQQRQPQVAHARQEALERRLVDRRACQAGCAVGLMRDPQAVEPVGPSRIEAAGDLNDK